MAVSVICAVENCHKSACNKRGWCNSHYLRWRRYGNPTAGRINHGEAQRYLAEVIMPYEGDECLVWPYCRDGNGYARISGGLVHVLVCENASGPKPALKHEATHSCGNGNLGCVTKGHLVWKTHTENMADKLIHGTHNRGERHGMSKLTENEVREIMSLKDKETKKHISKMFGVSMSNISAIHRGVSWSWVDFTCL
jgi:hypothetical protein